ncbi:MAG: DUF2232 domain-containing protein [Erysipelotrichaceae bacterium]|nr:DUF2232 domain-containing protein [Erysipelotrichaceae bacterium]
MNQTKKITQGAMMLAILGALILIDRITSYFFTELVVLIVPIIVIMYAAMNTFNDGLILSVGIIIMSFILGNFNITYLVYTPVGIITGLVYAWLNSKNKDRRTLLLSAVVTYTIGELISYYVISPLMGISIASMIESYKEELNILTSTSGVDYNGVFATLGVSMDKYLFIILLISTVLMGIMEGLLIHLLTIFLLKRFKIKDIGTISLWDSKPNAVLAYVSIFCIILLSISGFIDNETFRYISLTLALLGSIVLMYYAYIFFMLYGAIVFNKKTGGLVILVCFLIPALLIVCIIIGFLYASGPLRNYLERKRNEKLSQ